MVRVECGFVPLVDCATLAVAREMGFAAEEGIDLALHREPSWSNIRDKVSLGLYPMAHMLAPMPLAMSLGVGVLSSPVDVPFVLGVNGDTIGFSRRLADDAGAVPFGNAFAVGRALLRVGERRRVALGVPFPWSTHMELVRYLLAKCGDGRLGGVDIVTMPPPLMAPALAAGEIDAFCVGEPWGSVAVEAGSARLMLPGTAVWAFAPEKVLGVRRDWLEANAGLAAALVRALHRAARWAEAHAASTAELLARPAYLDLAPELVERALTGRLVVSATGELRHVERFLVLSVGAANFPWRSWALWIVRQAAARWGVDSEHAREVARGCFRPDLYRTALNPIGADLPGASMKVEGSLAERTAVSSSRGAMYLEPDRFFDGAVFDPNM